MSNINLSFLATQADEPEPGIPRLPSPSELVNEANPDTSNARSAERGSDAAQAKSITQSDVSEGRFDVQNPDHMWSLSGRVTDDDSMKNAAKIHFPEPDDKNFTFLQSFSGSNFKELGTIMGSVNYVHLAFKIDLFEMKRDIKERCQSLRTMGDQKRNDITYANETPLFSSIDSVRESLGEECKQIEHDVADFARTWDRTFAKRFVRSSENVRVSDEDFWNGTAPRVKRQILIAAALLVIGVIGIATYLFTHTQLASIHVNTGADKHTIANLERHETRQAIDQRSIHILEKADRAMTKVIMGVKDEVHYLESVLQMSATLSVLKRHYNGLLDGLRNLMSTGKVSNKLITAKGIGEALLSVRQTLARKQLKLGIQRMQDVFKMPASYLVTEDYQMHIYIHIPAYRDDTLMTLYEYIPMPIPVTSEGPYVKILPEFHILATSDDGKEFRSMSTTNLKLCERFRDIFYCNTQNFYDKRTQSNCLYALWRQNEQHIADSCPIRKHQVEDQLQQIDAETFLVYQHEYGLASRSCPDQKPENQKFMGLKMVKVPPGCRVTTTSFIFDGSFNIYSDSQSISFRTFNVTRMIPPEMGENLKSMILQNFDLIDSVKGLKIRDLASEYAKYNTVENIKIGLAAVLGVVGVAVFIICVLRCRHFCRRRREHAQYFAASGGIDGYIQEQMERGRNRKLAVRLSDLEKKNAEQGEEFQMEEKALKEKISDLQNKIILMHDESRSLASDPEQGDPLVSGETRAQVH